MNEFKCKCGNSIFTSSEDKSSIICTKCGNHTHKSEDCNNLIIDNECFEITSYVTLPDRYPSLFKVKIDTEHNLSKCECGNQIFVADNKDRNNLIADTKHKLFVCECGNKSFYHISNDVPDVHLSTIGVWICPKCSNVYKYDRKPGELSSDSDRIKIGNIYDEIDKDN